MWTSIWHTKTTQNVRFKFMHLLMRLLMMLPAQELLPLYWSLRRVNRKSECILIIVKVVPKQYQFKKYKNCFVLIQLHLMVKIYVCDAWLAVWIFFWEILFQNLWNISARLKQFTKQRFNNQQTVENEFFIHIIEICCNSGMLVKSFRYWLLNWQPQGGNLPSDLFPSTVILSFTVILCTNFGGSKVKLISSRRARK